MGILRKIAFAILFITFATFVALFGRIPALRNTPIGFLHRVFCLRLPRLLHAIDQRTTSGHIYAISARTIDHLANEKHPLVLIVFLGLVTGSAGLFLSSASSRLSSVHHYLIPIILGSPYYFTYKCASVTASEITSETLSENLLLYPYDSILYHAGVQCKTCKLQKPARSKHCSVCKTCIARHDHHCAWVNNCLGRANYHWFLALLASLGILLVYGSLLSHGLLASILPIEKQSGFKAFLDRWSYAITRDPRVGGVGLLALLTSPLAWGLFGYHVYLVWAGMTTNETNKWRMLREDMAHGLVFKRERLSTVVQVNGTATIYEWPVIPHQEIVRMTDGRRPRQDTFDEAASVPNDWEHCWRLSQVENIFDLGFAENLREIFFGTKVQR